MPEEARRGPKKLRFILSNQKELRTRAEKRNGMFSSFKHGILTTGKSAGHTLTSRRALALSARSLAVFMRYCWIMVKYSLLKLIIGYIYSDCSSFISPGRNTVLQTILTNLFSRQFQCWNIALFKARSDRRSDRKEGYLISGNAVTLGLNAVHLWFWHDSRQLSTKTREKK